MSEIFNLEPKNIENLELKLKGELPINRDELLALVNSFGRNDYFYTNDKDGNEILIEGCEANKKYDLSNLDVSEITNFNHIFRYSNFDGDISKWNVSNAISMVYMFAYTKEFNSPLDKWDISNVTSVEGMFYRAKNFNQNLNSWDISKVTAMYGVFFHAIKFNQPLNSWDTLNVVDMSFMFYDTTNFNQDISMWNVSKVTNMSFMFAHSKKFNQDLNSWDISKVKYINSMFEGVKDFNQPILWNISKAEDCDYMFYDSKIFKDKFNKGNELPKYTNDLKEWFIKNRTLMEAKNIDENKNKELDNFLSNFNIKEIYDKNI